MELITQDACFIAGCAVPRCHSTDSATNELWNKYIYIATLSATGYMPLPRKQSRFCKFNSLNCKEGHARVRSFFVFMSGIAIRYPGCESFITEQGNPELAPAH